MLELKIANNKVSDGNVSVTWCVDLEMLNALHKQEIRNPQLVLVVAPEGDAYHRSKEYRKVVPLKDLMTYLEFRVPGPNKIWAFVSKRSPKEAKTYLHKTYRSSFDEWILTQDGDSFARDDMEFDAEPLSIDVPKECFAPEPSEKEKEWVNRFFLTKAVDQCNFRRRRMLAYTVQPVAFLVEMLARTLVFLAALLTGQKGLTLKYLHSPLQNGFLDLTASDEMFGGGTVFINRKRDDWRQYILLPLMPPLLLAETALLYLFGVIIYRLIHLGSMKWFSIIVIGLLGIAATIAVFYFLYYGVIKYIEKLALLESKRPAWYLEKDEIDLITCGPGKKPLSFTDLPSKKKTIKLRFEDLKAKVCRPFSA